MARPIREKSGTGIYHVMLRGINRQDIFENDEDYQQISPVEEYGQILDIDTDDTKHVSDKMIRRTDPMIYRNGADFLYCVSFQPFSLRISGKLTTNP